MPVHGAQPAHRYLGRLRCAFRPMHLPVAVVQSFARFVLDQTSIPIGSSRRPTTRIKNQSTSPSRLCANSVTRATRRFNSASSIIQNSPLSLTFVNTDRARVRPCDCGSITKSLRQCALSTTDPRGSVVDKASNIRSSILGGDCGQFA